MYFNRKVVLLGLVAALQIEGSGFHRQAPVGPHDNLVRSVHHDIKRCQSAMDGDGSASLPDEVEIVGMGRVTFRPGMQNSGIKISEDGRVMRIPRGVISGKSVCQTRVGLIRLGWEEVAVANHLSQTEYLFLRIPQMKPIIMESVRDDAKLQYSIIADLIMGLKGVHELGLRMTTWAEERDQIGFKGDKAHWKFEGFNFASYVLNPESDGFVVQPVTLRRSYKYDIIRLIRMIRPRIGRSEFKFIYHVRSLPDWHDPLLVLEDAAMKATESFDYDLWSGFFGKLSRMDEMEVRDAISKYWDNRRPDPRIASPTISDDYWGLFRECLTEFEESNCNRPELPELCTQPGMFTFNSGEDLVIDTEKVKEGYSGLAYPSADKTMFLKISKSACGNRKTVEEHVGSTWNDLLPESQDALRAQFIHQSVDKQRESLRSLCSERSVLRVLDGLGGRVPREFAIESASEPMCAKISILTENAGLYAFEESVSMLTPSQIFSSVAQVIVTLRELNKAGFIQNDFHLHNLIFSSLEDPAGTLKLIDFGFAVPIRGENGVTTFAEAFSNLVKLDFMNLAMELLILLKPSKLIPAEFIKSIREPIEAFYGDIDSLGVFESPDYDKWIGTFNHMAQMASGLH